jgi:cytochrome bd-type quinol oxidase subunit 1
MEALNLARWQFGITSVYHFFFVPLTLGLAPLVAIMETLYVRSGDETYKRMAQFWGKLFLINCSYPLSLIPHPLPSHYSITPSSGSWLG